MDGNFTDWSAVSPIDLDPDLGDGEDAPGREIRQVLAAREDSTVCKYDTRRSEQAATGCACSRRKLEDGHADDRAKQAGQAPDFLSPAESFGLTLDRPPRISKILMYSI